MDRTHSPLGVDVQTVIPYLSCFELTYYLFISSSISFQGPSRVSRGRSLIRGSSTPLVMPPIFRSRCHGSQGPWLEVSFVRVGYLLWRVGQD
jgi:hypothetical protein